MGMFPLVGLADCADILAGYAFKSQHFTNNPNDIALVKGENISQGHILWDISKRWSTADWATLKKFQLHTGDVVVAMDRPWVPAGLKWASIREGDPKALLVQRCARLRSRSANLDQNFLRFVIGGPTFESYIRPITTGVNVPHISAAQILGFQFALPPLPAQRRIASILSAYDELIENSQRRIRILEDMARALYREWFVHFRFPGHEAVPLVLSPLGEIPQGWKYVPFSRLLASAIGGDWGTEESDEINSTQVVVVRGTDFDELAYGGKLRSPIRYIKPSSFQSRSLRPGDVIVENSVNAKSRCIGTPLLINEQTLTRLNLKAIAASFCKVFRPHNQNLSSLIFLHLRYLREHKRMEYYQNVAANGIGNFQTTKFLKEEQLVLPADSDLQSRLISHITTLITETSTLASQIQILRQTRDLLLPRLLSGQIDVCGLELPQ